MKRYFVETNGYNCVAFVDDNGTAYIVHENNFDEPLTLDVAKTADYSNFDNCGTAEECAQAIGTSEVLENIVAFDEILKDAENSTEF